VMMRHQNIGEFPSCLLQRQLDRRSLWGVDCGGRATLWIVEQNAEIIFQTEKKIGLCRHFFTVKFRTPSKLALPEDQYIPR
jgi:hypothetical protein